MFLFVHMHVYVCSCVSTVCVYVHMCFVALTQLISFVGIFEKPDAEAEAAAKSRRLNLLEVYYNLFFKQTQTSLNSCMYVLVQRNL